jgi:hypothetical protein
LFWWQVHTATPSFFPWEWISWTFCLGWPGKMLISASWVVKITGVSHWHPALKISFNITYFLSF